VKATMFLVILTQEADRVHASICSFELYGRLPAGDFKQT